MIRSIIAAVAKNRVIGKDNRLVWRLPNDMKFFVETTMGHCVIMGRKNFESIPPAFRPFKGRTNIIVSTNPDYNAPGCFIVGSIEEALALAKSKNETEAFIIGGGQIYNQYLSQNLIDKMYITEIDQTFDGDVYFPIFDKNEWLETQRIAHERDDKHAYSFDFVTYMKKK